MRKYTVIIPHYKTGKMTAYCIHQILKYSKGRELDIVVVDNSGGIGVEYLLPFKDITLLTYPADKMQSHGLAFDYALQRLPFVQDYFITLESDSFPRNDIWLEYYDALIDEGYEMAASVLKLSGGTYYHPAGAMYKTSNWIEARQYVNELNAKYKYYPNYIHKDGFPCHIMIHKDGVIDYSGFTLHENYKNIDPDINARPYEPIAQSVFHQGMGFNQESYPTYGKRDLNTGKQDFISVWTESLIYRMGYEPGQWFGYWHLANNKKVKTIQTETVWMDKRVNQQQEYTITENGVKHLWGVTAYGTSPDNEALQDIINRKKQLIEQLYESI
jgi:hypothetical protein